MEKKYELTKLQAPHLFALARFLKKVKFKQFQDFGANVLEAMKNMKDVDDLASLSVVFLELLDIILETVSNYEDDTYVLLSKFSNLSVDEVKELDLLEFVEMIEALVKHEDFKQLFQRAVSLMPKAN